MSERIGERVQVTIEGTVTATTEGSFVAITFRDAYANEHTLWFSSMHKVGPVQDCSNGVAQSVPESSSLDTWYIIKNTMRLTVVRDAIARWRKKHATPEGGDHADH